MEAMSWKLVRDLALFMICLLIVLAAVLAIPVMIGFVVAHVHHMVKGR